MRPVEFVREIEEYWEKNKEASHVSKSIAEHVRNANSPALGATLRELKKVVAPNYLVGVKHVAEAATSAGASLVKMESRRFDVKCDGCGRVYSYAQGVSDDCPFCDLPYSATQRMNEYKEFGKIPSGYAAYYMKQLDRAAERLKETTGESYERNQRD